MWVKQHVGMKSQVILTISSVEIYDSSLENRVPEEYGGMKYGGECIWEYEIEGFWSTCEWFPFLFTNSGDYDIQYFYWRDLHSNSRVVHLREQASSRVAQHFTEQLSCWTRGGEGTCCVVASLLYSPSFFHHPPPLFSTPLHPFPHQSQHTNSHNAMTPIKTPSSPQTIPGTARTVIKHHSHTARVSHHSFRS